MIADTAKWSGNQEMKSLIILTALFGTGVLLAFPGSLTAQKQAIENKGLYELKAKAQRSIQTRPRRVERKNEMFANRVVIRSEYSISEYLSRNRQNDI